MPLDTSTLPGEFASLGALIDMYETHVDAVHAVDAELGDTVAKGANFFNELKASNVEAATKGQSILDEINAMTDAEAQAVVAFIVSRDRGISAIATAYAVANQPTAEANKLSNDAIAQLWNKRSVEQRSASALRTALDLSPLPEEFKAQISELPAGKRGAAPGTKRGKMGRKIPAGVDWTVDGEEVGEKSAKDLASLLGVSVADVRNHLETTFVDALPKVFETTINGKVVKGVQGEPSTPAADDDDDTDTDDLGEIDFDLDDI